MRPILSSRARISFSSGAECARAEALDVRVRPEPSGPSERAAQGAGWAYVCSAHSVDALTKTQIGGFRDSRSAKVYIKVFRARCVWPREDSQNLTEFGPSFS